MDSKFSYSFIGSETLITPSLIYYKELIQKNIKKAIEMARGADHLWPHIKSHKMAEIVNMSISLGIMRFKCATIAEAEMVANCGASHIVVAYPLIGPNIKRFLTLSKSYPNTHFYAVGDDFKMISLLGESAYASSSNVNFLIDVNMGMNRTGVPLHRVIDFFHSIRSLKGINVCGLHCYDGDRTEHELNERKMRAASLDKELLTIYNQLIELDSNSSLIIMGGSPSFPCHLDFPGAFFSPGTLFIYDYGYAKKFPDLEYTPAAAILTRVISTPSPGVFSLDLGYKGIASDPPGIRGIILNFENYEELFQSEEHWTFRMKPGHENECPKVGTEFLVIPTHICPTSALYPNAYVIENGNVVDNWEVSARNRKITI